MSEIEVSAIIAGDESSMALAITPCGNHTFWYYEKSWHMTGGLDPDFNCRYFLAQSALALYLLGGRKTYRGIFKIKVQEAS